MFLRQSLAKNKIIEKKDRSAFGGVALSTLGEKIKNSNPKVAEHGKILNYFKRAANLPLRVFITRRLQYLKMFYD